MKTLTRTSGIHPGAPVLAFCLAVLLFRAVPASAMQILEAADHAELEAVVSDRAVSRITLAGGRGGPGSSPQTPATPPAAQKTSISATRCCGWSGGLCGRHALLPDDAPQSVSAVPSAPWWRERPEVFLLTDRISMPSPVFRRWDIVHGGEILVVC